MITENLVKRLISPYLKRMKSRAEPVIIPHNGVPRNLREGRRKSSSRHVETWNAPKKSAKKHTANSSHILEDTYECRYSWALACVLGWSLIWLASFSPTHSKVVYAEAVLDASRRRLRVCCLRGRSFLSLFSRFFFHLTWNTFLLLYFSASPQRIEVAPKWGIEYPPPMDFSQYSWHMKRRKREAVLGIWSSLT